MNLKNIGMGTTQATATSATGEHIQVLLMKSYNGWFVHATMGDKTVDFEKRDCTRYAAAEEAIDRLCHA
jgi:hypothetical protein